MPSIRLRWVASLVAVVCVSSVAYAQPGRLDQTFATTGKVTTTFAGLDQARDIAIQADGKIVVVGRAAATDPASGNFAVARYLSNGTLDGSFGSGGKATTDFAGLEDEATRVAIQPDGKIVVGGYASFIMTAGNPPAKRVALARYLANGTPDSSFGVGGKATMYQVSVTAFDGVTLLCRHWYTAVVSGVEDLALQPDGRILVAMRAYDGFEYMGIARFTTSGDPDITFSGPSPLVFQRECPTFGYVLDWKFDAVAFGVTIQPNNRIILAGNVNGNELVALSAHLPSGARDTTFGDNGWAMHEPPLFALTEQGTAIVTQPDGKMVVSAIMWAANHGTTLRDRLEVKRYHADGSLDLSFGTGGTASEFGLNTDLRAYHLAIDGLGNIVVGGVIGADGSPTGADALLVRLTPQGAIDQTFGTTHFNAVSFSGADSAAAIALQPDGRILLAGRTSMNASQSEFAIARLEGGTVACTYALDATAAAVGAVGGAARITVTAPRGCPWIATSDASWLTLLYESQSGEGWFSYIYSGNIQSSPRTGKITVGGQTFTLTQAGSTPPSIQTQPRDVSLPPGWVAQFSVVATAQPTPTYRWQLSSNGSTWTDVPDQAPYYGATTNVLSVAPTAASLNGLRFRVVVSNVALSITSNEALLTVDSTPQLGLDRTTLQFGMVMNGANLIAQTGTQFVRLVQTAGASVAWTAQSSHAWLRVTPASGSGSETLSISVANVPGLPAQGSVNGTITLTLPGGVTAPGPIGVTLNVIPANTAKLPSGVVDTPTDLITGVTGAIPFTGWAIDDVEVSKVTLCRATVAPEAVGSDPNCGGTSEIFVGNAVFIDGARPDVAALHSKVPRNTRAGWGFMVLTNMLPNQGNGTYRFVARAFDADGRSAVLGTRTISCANANATKPFGAIDTPTQGGTVSGTSFVNFGWVLAPGGKSIPTDGSTMTVLIDGVAIGSVDYNHFRPDIAAIFPGYANSNAAVGFRILDTTTLSNGIHTISWTVTDSAGVTEGIGSRFFTVVNGVASVAAAATSASTAFEVDAAPIDWRPVLARRGWDLDGTWQIHFPRGAQPLVVRGEEVDRFELWLPDDADASYTGYLRTSAGLQALPAGAQIHPSGWFTWAPPPGFIGRYDLVFVRSRGAAVIGRHDVRIVIGAKTQE
jgi:uncharacterized delta-60 repeat protein